MRAQLDDCRHHLGVFLSGCGDHHRQRHRKAAREDLPQREKPRHKPRPRYLLKPMPFRTLGQALAADARFGQYVGACVVAWGAKLAVAAEVARRLQGCTRRIASAVELHRPPWSNAPIDTAQNATMPGMADKCGQRAPATLSEAAADVPKLLRMAQRPAAYLGCVEILLPPSRVGRWSAADIRFITDTISGASHEPPICDRHRRGRSRHHRAVPTLITPAQAQVDVYIGTPQPQPVPP